MMVAKQARHLNTFRVGAWHFAVDIAAVQEIVVDIPITKVPLADAYLAGLINLRGQIATVLDLRRFFKLDMEDERDQAIYAVTKHPDGDLISLLVDDVGEVIEVQPDQVNDVPVTIEENLGEYVAGLTKVNGHLVSILDTERIFQAVRKVA